MIGGWFVIVLCAHSRITIEVLSFVLRRLPKISRYSIWLAKSAALVLYINLRVVLSEFDLGLISDCSCFVNIWGLDPFHFLDFLRFGSWNWSFHSQRHFDQSLICVLLGLGLDSIATRFPFPLLDEILLNSPLSKLPIKVFFDMFLIFFGENQSVVTSNVLFRPGVQYSYGTLPEKVTIHSIHVRSHFESTGSNVSVCLIRPSSIVAGTEFPLLSLHSQIVSSSMTNIQDGILMVQAVDSLD